MEYINKLIAEYGIDLSRCATDKDAAIKFNVEEKIFRDCYPNDWIHPAFRAIEQDNFLAQKALRGLERGGFPKSVKPITERFYTVEGGFPISVPTVIKKPSTTGYGEGIDQNGNNVRLIPTGFSDIYKLIISGFSGASESMPKLNSCGKSFSKSPQWCSAANREKIKQLYPQYSVSNYEGIVGFQGGFTVTLNG